MVTARLAYLSLHRARAGQGGDTHIGAICEGMEDRGWAVRVHAPVQTPGGQGGFLFRVGQFLWPQLKLIASARRGDVVYVRHHPLAVLVGMWTKLSGIHRIEEVNGTLQDWYAIYPSLTRFSWLLSRLSSRLLSTASAVIAVNSGLARWVAESSGRAEVCVIPNAAHPEVFSPLPQGRVNGRPYVVFAGALTPWEGVHTLLAAVASSEWPPDLELVIAGRGPLESLVGDLASTSRQLTYLGNLDRTEVASLVGQATAALSPYWKPPYGASPIKLYEAMSCGIPVIASRSPGQLEVVAAEECGLLVEPEDPVAICAAIKSILRSPDHAMAMGKRGRLAVLSRHSWHHRVAKTDALLRGLEGSRQDWVQ